MTATSLVQPRHRREIALGRPMSRETRPAPLLVRPRPGCTLHPQVSAGLGRKEDGRVRMLPIPARAQAFRAKRAHGCAQALSARPRSAWTILGSPRRRTMARIRSRDQAVGFPPRRGRRSGWWFGRPLESRVCSWSTAVYREQPRFPKGQTAMRGSNCARGRRQGATGTTVRQVCVTLTPQGVCYPASCPSSSRAMQAVVSSALSPSGA